MASNYVEKIHEDLLKRLMEDSELTCIRSRQQSIEFTAIEEELPELVIEEEPKAKVEEFAEEIEEFIFEEEIKVEEPTIFPSPSLRKVLTDKVRKIEKQNRVRVLPEVFKKNIDPADIPKIATTPQKKYIDILASMVGCKNYKSSLAEFWFLDTLANLLRRAQEDDLNRPTQALLILWFCEWMKEMQEFDAADRQRMLRRFKDNMLAAARFVAKEGCLPSPEDVGVYYKTMVDLPEGTGTTTPDQLPYKPKSREPLEAPLEPSVTFEGTGFECAMADLTRIIHYIFDLFSTDYQYNLVRSVFTFTPDYVLIDSPYQLQVPKRMYTALKVKPKKEKSPKKEVGKGKKKKEPDTEEFIALMQLKAKEELEIEAQEEKEREDYNLRSHILPLAFATTQELLDKYWPPPPTPEPEPEPEPVHKGKGKKK